MPESKRQANTRWFCKSNELCSSSIYGVAVAFSEIVVFRHGWAFFCVFFFVRPRFDSPREVVLQKISGSESENKNKNKNKKGEQDFRPSS